MKLIAAACVMVLSLISGADLVAKELKQTLNEKSRVKVISDDSVLEELNLPSNHQPFNTNEFEILVWNIYKGMKMGLYEDLFELVQGKSLVLLQEGYQNATSSKFIEATSNLQWLMASSFVDKNGSRTGVITGSTQIASGFTFRKSPDNEPIFNTPKMSVISYYDLPVVGGEQKKLLVINIHAINFVSTSAFKRHIIQNFDVIAKHSSPVLFVGDFNTWNNDRAVYLEQAAKDAGLKKVKFPGKIQPKLDHVYYRGFEITDAKLHLDISSSDHKPITVKLRLGNSQP